MSLSSISPVISGEATLPVQTPAPTAKPVQPQPPVLKQDTVTISSGPRSADGDSDAS